jgi:hypothetical protein
MSALAKQLFPPPPPKQSLAVFFGAGTDVEPGVGVGGVTGVGVGGEVDVGRGLGSVMLAGAKRPALVAATTRKTIRNAIRYGIELGRGRSGALGVTSQTKIPIAAIPKVKTIKAKMIRNASRGEITSKTVRAMVSRKINSNTASAIPAMPALAAAVLKMLASIKVPVRRYHLKAGVLESTTAFT